jgi:tetratricopeptide (TPR) repeat protein
VRRSGLIVLAAAAFVVVALALRQPASPPQVIEDAYRANNVGVARLEQFDYTAAAEAFRTALRLSPSLALARVNLAIALFYALDLDGAQHEIEEAARLLPRDPRPPYVLGLIARAQGRLDAAREAFKRVRELDPRDVGTLINAGQIDLQERREADAISAFRAALNEEPYNVTASYNLGLALTRSGRRDEGQKVMEESQAVRASGYGTIFSTNYLEQGHYAEAMTSTGAEPDLADRAIPDVTFAATAIGLSVAQSTAPIQSPFGRRFSSADLADDGRAIADAVAGGVTAFDYDGDGDSDLLVVRAGDARLLRNDRGAFADVTRESGIGSLLGSGAIAAVAGDYDNDGAPDLFVIRYGRNLLLHNDGGGRFSDVTAQSGLPAYRFLSTSAAFVDFDHDGDLDIVIVGLADLDRAREGAAARALTFPDDFPGAPAVLLQNNGNGTFTDITGKTGVSGLRHGVAIVPTDYDNRRDVDLLIASYDGTPALFTNLRDGTFRDDASKVGIAIEGRVTSVAAADFNKDDFTDFFFGRASAPGVFAISDGRGRFRMVPAPEATAGALAAQFVDYDNDGVIDLLTWSADGPRLLRGGAGEWSDVTARAFGGTASGASAPRSARAALAADVDGDGDMDVIASDAAAGNVAVWRNDGGSRNASMRVRLTARVSNRSALGAKIDLRAGSLRQRLESSSSAPPAVPADILFGLGRRRGADVVRVLWPSGILQAEAANSTSNTSNTGAVLTSPMIVEELNRKPSSCPFLFTWNGRRFEFVTDFMGGGEMGYWEAPGVRNKPDPEEYVRISDEQLQPKDGRYELRITNELEETMFVDRLSLLAVTHRRDEEVFPNEGMTDPPKPFRLFQAREIGPPPRVTDDRGHDVTARIAAVDGAYPDDFRLSPIRGYAAPHALTIALGAVRPSLLLLTGWTDYAFSSDNVAADQAGLALQPPALEARGADGRWRTIVADIGIPVGRPQTIVVDLKGRLAAGTTDVRIVTNMRIYWDRILFANQADGGAQIDRLEPAAAVLRTRGFSAELTPKSPQPITYDYQRVTRISPWKTMVGTYTREGNVLPLLMRTDDQFVIAGPGDEIALSFDAGKLPPLEPGFTRTFLLHADGFSKEMDLHSASPDAVAPLPFHGMRRYPYAPSDAPPDTPEKERYRTEYNTRRVMRQLPPLNGTELPSRDHRRER